MTSYRLSHHILKTKKPFTLNEEVIKPALQIVTEQLLDKETERTFQNITLSDTTVSRRGFHMVENLLEQLLCCWKISFLIRKLIAFIPAFDLGYNSQYSMCCPYSTPVFKGKVQIYFPKLEKLMPLKEKLTAGPIKC